MKESIPKGKHVETEKSTDNKGKNKDSKFDTIAIKFKFDAAERKKSVAFENIVDKFAQNQRQMKKIALKKTLKKQALLQLKELNVSVTIFVGSIDISIELLEKINEFIEKKCISRLCSIERSGALLRLHI